MKNDRFVTIRCIFVPVGWDAASPGNEKIRLPNDRTYAGAAAQPLVCLSFPDAFFFCPGTPEPPPVSRRPSAPSGSLFRMPPGPAAPIDRKRLFPARESCLPPAPPPSLAPAPPNRFRYPGARLLRPEQDGRERLRPSGRSAAASGGPAGRPTPAGRGTAIPPRRSQTGRFPSTAAPASRRTTPGSGTDVAYRCV